MGKLSERIEEYVAGGLTPFHMPGHKRKTEDLPEMLRGLYGWDLTEVPGTDDLQDPEEGGMLKEALERAADLYGAEESFFLLGGSTIGVLTAISAATDFGGTILLQRSSHKSAYHAAELRGLSLKYLSGEKGGDAADAVVGVEEVRERVESDPAIRAVFLTSPSYAGYSDDLRRIAEYLHTRKIPLIVDAAHGAHFGMAEFLPENAVQAGADLTVMSLHKMLPAPTQTALLHIGKGADRTLRERVRHFLGIYQSTSPSYPLMAGIDHCICLLQKWKSEGNAVWQAWYERRKCLSRKLRELKQINVIDHFTDTDGPKPEIGKLLLCPKDRRSGYRLEELLRTKYLCQAEMALPQYVLLICTVMDTAEDYEHLAEALRKIDAEEDFSGKAENAEAGPGMEELPEAVMTLLEASGRPTERIPVLKAVGRICASSVSVYPPGRPMVLPGERITETMAARIEKLRRAGAHLHGVSPEGEITVLPETEGI